MMLRLKGCIEKTLTKIITRVTRANRWNTIINLVGLCKSLNFFSTLFFLETMGMASLQ